MIPYILHVTVITTVCFLFYKLLLQKVTFYRLNRWTLMGCLAISFALPLLPVPSGWSWRDKWNAPQTPAVAVSTAPVPLNPAAVSAAPVPLKPVAISAAPAQYNPVAVSAAPVQYNPVADWTYGRQETTGTAPATNHARAAVLRKAARTMEHKTSTSSLYTDAGSQSAAASTGIDIREAGPATPSGAAPTVSSATASTANASTGTPGVTLLAVIRWIFYAYLAGVLFFGINFLLQLAVLLYQSYSRPVIRDGRFRIVEVSGNRAPCSFGNTIFINPANYDWETYNQILIHEKIHVSGGHTLDILLAETALVIQWFNPFAWLYRREVENNLEFLTDSHVLLHRDVERSVYQLSLLRVSAPHLPFSITNNYNQSLLKRRIVMMNSKRSSLHTIWKYFFLIPLLTGLMCALNKPVVALAAASRKSSLPITADTTKKPVKHPGEPSPAHTRFNSNDSSTADSFNDGKRGSSGQGHSEAFDDDRYTDETTARTLMYQDMNAVSDGGSFVVRPEITLRPETSVHPEITVHPRNIERQTMTYGPEVNFTKLFAVDARVNVKLRMPEFRGLAVVDDTVLYDGSWYATSYDDKLSFELKAGDDDHYWSNTLHVDKSEINPFPGQGTVEFKLVRDAGTIVFKGQFDGQEGFGHFHYTPDASYFQALKALGVEDLDDRRQFAFFTLNVKKDYVDMVVHNGYPHISRRDLLSFASMHIDQAFIQLWHGADIAGMDASEPRNLIRLKAMRIDRAYIDELKATGYDHLSLRDLESMKAQHIDGAYIRSIGRGAGNQPIPVHDLVMYKAVHVDSNYLGELRKLGYANLSIRDVASLYAQHVTPDYIRQMQDAGYKDLSARDLCMLMAMHVTPEYIRGFHDLGYKDADVRIFTRFKAQDITPEFIKGFADLGYTDLTANQLCQLKAMNITPAYVGEFNKIGFDHIPVRLLTSLKATGVNADYVSKMKSQGFVSKDLVKYIRLKNDFN